MPSGNKVLPEPIFTKFHNAMWVHIAIMSSIPLPRLNVHICYTSLLVDNFWLSKNLIIFQIQNSISLTQISMICLGFDFIGVVCIQIGAILNAHRDIYHPLYRFVLVYVIFAECDNCHAIFSDRLVFWMLTTPHILEGPAWSAGCQNMHTVLARVHHRYPQDGLKASVGHG